MSFRGGLVDTSGRLGYILAQDDALSAGLERHASHRWPWSRGLAPAMRRSRVQRLDAVRYAVGGATHGALVWCAYGVVEQGFCFLLAMLHGLHAVHGPAEWDVIAALAGAYLVAGTVLGGGVGFALALADRRRRRHEGVPSADRLRAAGVATLALAFAVHLALVRPFGKAEALSLALGLGIAAVAVACVWSERLMAAAGGIASPWAATLVLLGAASTGRELLGGTSAAVQLAGAGAFVLLVAGTAVAGSHLARGRAHRRDTFLPARGAVGLGGGVLLVGALGLVATKGPSPGASAASVPAGRRPNLVLVTMDTVRADHLSLYGYKEETAPALDALARRATVFTNAFATSDQTLTTHASIFTGLYGSWHGAYPAAKGFPRGRPLGAAHPTLAQRLALQGYRTVAVVANYAYLGAAFGLDRGFQECDVQVPSTIADAFYMRERLLGWMGRLFSWPDLYVRCARAEQVNRDALAALRSSASAGSPLLLFVNYMDAHVPYIPPRPFDTLFPGRSDHLGPGDYPHMRAEVMTGRRGITLEERRHFVSQYDGAIRYMDGELKRLVDGLVELGLYEGSMIVICGDHGEAFGDRGLVQHGVSVYQDQVRVPLIIKFPGQHDPRTVAAPVSQIDVLPTILTALGLGAAHDLPGRDLAAGAFEQPRTLFAESFYLRGFGARFDRIERAALEWPMKLVDSSAGTRELYDLSADPGELHDLFRPDDPRVQGLLGALAAWIRAVPPSPREGRPLDEDTLRRLRALGYAN